MNIDPDVSRRINIARLLLICGVVVTHIQPQIFITNIDYSLADTIKLFFSNVFFKVGVPILATISGYLLFSSRIHKDLPTLFVRKLRSIGIPLVAWNLPFVLLFFLLQIYMPQTFQGEWYSLYPFSLETWLSAIFAVFDTPINYPLYFLRDIFLITVLAPVYWSVFKKVPYIGLVVTFVIFYFNLDQGFILRNSVYFCFYLGILAATQQWNINCLDKYGYHLFSLYLAACLFIIFKKIEDIEAFIVFTPLLIWPVLSKLVNTRCGYFFEKYSQYSFLLFLSHLPILYVMHKLYLAFLPGIPYLIFWALSAIITICICLFILPLAGRLMPNVYRLAVGGR